jgi:apolipoprotein N-acyltransferase
MHQSHYSGSHPNMFGAALIAGVLGTLMAVLAISDLATTGTTSFGSAMLAVALLVAAHWAFGLHRKLGGMTPEGREAYWRAFDEAHRENHERNVEMYVRRGRDGNGLG